MLGEEETVKVVARLAIESFPQDVRNYEAILDRATISLEKAVNMFESLQKPLRFCFYCLGASFLLVGTSRLVRAFRVNRDK